jgi:hypothetical protein
MVRLAGVIRSRAPGQPVAVLSPRLADAFPLVLYSGARWALRAPHLWCLQALLPDATESAPRSDAERACVAPVGEDLARSQPALILVRRQVPDGPADLRFDYLRALLRDPDFRRQLERYELTDSVAGFDVYRRRRGPVPVAFCRFHTSARCCPGGLEGKDSLDFRLGHDV